MFRAAPRLVAHSAVRSAPFRPFAPIRRTLTTAPPSQKSRSWKSLVARIGLAGAAVYYYNTTDVFAEEPGHYVQALPETEVESEHLPTIESISEERRRRQAIQAQLDNQKQKQKQQETAAPQQNARPTSGGEGGIEGLEEEADQQGAFNPETGEINWDCPCLGGMAHGPCGEEFKTAFSCFVYSKEEPKGMDCIDNFKNMQNCFRQYPEVYGSELDSDAEDDDEVAADLAASESIPASSASDTPSSSLSTSDVSSDAQTAPSKTKQTSEHAKSVKGTLSGQATSEPHSAEQVEENRRELGLVPENYRPSPKKSTKVDGKNDTASATNVSQQMKTEEPISESERVVPKAAFDTGDENTKVLERK